MRVVVVGGMPESLLGLIKEIASRDPGRASVEFMPLDKVSGKNVDLVIMDEVPFDLDIQEIIKKHETAIIPMIDIPSPRRSKGDRHRNKRYRWSE